MMIAVEVTFKVDGDKVFTCLTNHSMGDMECSMEEITPENFDRLVTRIQAEAVVNEIKGSLMGFLGFIKGLRKEDEFPEEIEI